MEEVVPGLYVKFVNRHAVHFRIMVDAERGWDLFSSSPPESEKCTLKDDTRWEYTLVVPLTPKEGLTVCQKCTGGADSSVLPETILSIRASRSTPGFSEFMAWMSGVLRRDGYTLRARFHADSSPDLVKVHAATVARLDDAMVASESGLLRFVAKTLGISI